MLIDVPSNGLQCVKPAPQRPIEICILAGGLSRRMGRDKSLLRLGGRTLLGRVRSSAKALNLPVRVIRRDIVARCGPLGGVFTALKSTKADAVLFLACDMPFVTDQFLRTVLNRFGQNKKALFSQFRGKPGFPFVLHRGVLPIVSRRIEQREFSLGQLASELGGNFFTPPLGQREQLRNLNSPEEWARAVKISERNTRSVRRNKPRRLVQTAPI